MTKFHSEKKGNLHVCNWSGCRRPVPFDMWGCKGHWFTLPQEHRNAILEAWRFGHGRASQKWLDANAAAQEWIRGMPERLAAMNIGRNTPVPGHGGGNADSDSSAG
jgi:hypothetical protein